MQQIGIIGNDGCDADSIVCALAYSKFKSACCDCNENKDEEKQTFTPFFQCDNIDMRLDFVSVCEEAGLSRDEYVNAVTPITKYKKGDIKQWILLDHHYPTKTFRKNIGDETIIEVIDHHMTIVDEEKKLVETLKKEGKFENKEVGSCATLVAKRLLRCLMGKPEAKENLLPYMKMLLFTILIDTSNLGNPKKTTQDDKDVVESLKTETGITDEQIGTEDTEGIYKKLLESKFSESFWGTQPLNVILSYDYKSGDAYKVKLSDSDVQYGMASVLRNIEDSELPAIIEYYEKELGLKAFAINTTTRQNLKQLILFNFPNVVIDKLLETSKQLKTKGDLTGDDKKMTIFESDTVIETGINGVVRLLAPSTFSRKSFIEEMGILQPLFSEVQNDVKEVKVETPAFAFRSKNTNKRSTKNKRSRKLTSRSRKARSVKAKVKASTKVSRSKRSRKERSVKASSTTSTKASRAKRSNKRSTKSRMVKASAKTSRAKRSTKKSRKIRSAKPRKERSKKATSRAVRVKKVKEEQPPKKMAVKRSGGLYYVNGKVYKPSRGNMVLV